jgi:hypothetical protein
MTDTPIAPVPAAAAPAAPKRPGRPRGSTKRAGRVPQERAAPVHTETKRPAVRAIPQGLQRVDRHDEDMFSIPFGMVPPGWSYEWKRTSCFNKPDPRHMNNLRENHWEPVPADRHPGFMVEQDGMMLMERPAYVTKDAQIAQYNKAQRVVQGVRGSLFEAPQGTMDRNHPSVRAAMKLNRNYDNMGISVDPNAAEER